MDYLWVVAVVAVLAVILVVTGRLGVSRARRERQEWQALLSSSMRVAGEDLARFTEEFHALALAAERHPDALVRGLHSRAEAALADAQAAFKSVSDSAEVGGVTEILREGQYTLACLQARLAGDPLPERRQPCFFNPAHGPSDRDVEWSTDAAPSHTVPACAADAARLLAGAEPNIRTVPRGAHRVPHWEGGPAYRAWSQGYFGHGQRAAPERWAITPVQVD
ncbi:MAG: hypothetical protein WAS07_08035 [Micropruina sp.]